MLFKIRFGICSAFGAEIHYMKCVQFLVFGIEPVYSKPSAQSVAAVMHIGNGFYNSGSVKTLAGGIHRSEYRTGIYYLVIAESVIYMPEIFHL
jgi:hypothetical protein